MLTASDDDDLLFEAIKAGAQGYLVKHLDPSPFLEEVRRQLNGEAAISGDVALKIIRAFSHHQSEPPQGALTSREYEVLSLVGQGHSNREIATSTNHFGNTVKPSAKYLAKLHLKIGCKRLRTLFDMDWWTAVKPWGWGNYARS